MVGFIIGIVAGISEASKNHGFFGFFFGGLAMAFAICGTPAGWRALSAITPNIFLWMSLVGWGIYYLIKELLAYFLGIIMFPIQAVRTFLSYKKAKAEHLEVLNREKQEYH